MKKKHLWGEPEHIIGMGGISMTSITLKINGMHCGACVRRVTQALQRVNGAEVQEVRIGAARVQVEDAETCESALLASIEKAGYSALVEQ